MNNQDDRLQSIDAATLTPLVRKALDSGTVEIVDWHRQEIYRSPVRSRAVYRFSGRGLDQSGAVAWSLILKVVDSGSHDVSPLGWEFWKREALAYEAGLLDELPGGLAAPRCFGVADQPGGRCWIWLEDLRDAIGAEWPLTHYGVVARHLGQFNGAYVMGRPIPSQPWLSRGWLRQHVATQGSWGIALLRDSLGHRLVRRAFPLEVAQGLFRLWAEREEFLSAIDRVPQAFCHLDAFRRNLFARQSAGGGHQTVAVDWSYVGTGAVGEDIAPLVLATAMLQDVELSKAKSLDEVVFAGYLGGLRDAGWHDDIQGVRVAYAAASAVRYGIGYPLPGFVSLLLDDSAHAGFEETWGCSMEERADQWAEYVRFLLALADEARELMEDLPG